MPSSGLRTARYGDERWLEILVDEPLLLKMPLVRHGNALTDRRGGDDVEELVGGMRRLGSARARVMTQIAVSGAGVEFGATTLFSDVTFTIAAGERWGVVGRNGTGKTTLFKLMTGELAPTRGAVSRQTGLSLSLLGQHRDFGDGDDGLGGSGRPVRRASRARAIARRAGRTRWPTSAMRRHCRDTGAIWSGSSVRVATPSLRASTPCCRGSASIRPARAASRSTQLSGGERGRVGLARQLVAPSDILLLDEPTNHLDLETTQWLEEYLQELDRTVVLVSHDRAFLAAVVDHVLHFEGGYGDAIRRQLRGVRPAAAGAAAVAAARVRQAAEGRSRARRTTSRATSPARTPSRRRGVARGSNAFRGSARRSARKERMALRLDVAERGGDQVAVAENVTTARAGADADRAVQRPSDARRSAGDHRSERRGQVHAAARAGRRARAGRGRAASRQARFASAYYDQQLEQVPLDKTLYDVIADLRPQWERRLVQGHLGRFGFSGDEVQRRAATLSGGERARVALAMLMLTHANLLVLDEPTNHLDVESIEVLEDAIEGYEGTVILVSHDRAMLRAIASKVWVLHERHITEFDGSFAEWEVVSEERAHAASVRASEELALRRVDGEEAHGAARGAPSRPDPRRQLRQARERAERAEREVAELEAEVSALTATLDDPELYTRPGGVEEANRLGARLESVRVAARPRARDVGAGDGFARIARARDDPFSLMEIIP